jgi:diguanylate cyclase (GGDEF)-like protein
MVDPSVHDSAEDRPGSQAIGLKTDTERVIETGRTEQEGRRDLDSLAPPVVSRQRVVEGAGKVDRATQVTAAMVGAILLGTGLFRGSWALLPLIVLVGSLALGPLAIRRGARPQVIELAVSLLITIAMAAAAGLTGGTSSPLVFLLPIGVVMNARRAGPRPVVLCAVVTAVVFVGVSLADHSATVLGEPLPMLAVLAMQAGVTIAAIALAGAEIDHRRASIVDPLTGLLNRQGLVVRFEELRQQAFRTAAPITLILFDLDHFKQINDSRGHDVGDRILCDVADEIRHTLRAFELVYRVGGEEFLILLPGMEEWEGGNLAERLRLAIAVLGQTTGSGVTASFGVSSSHDAGADFDRLYRQADQALYRAKRGGRDRVEATSSVVLDLTL